jgi:hypothetical protein
MGVSEILATIDQEIAQLQETRALLGGGAALAAKKKAGRPKRVAAVVPVATIPSIGPVLPVLSSHKSH